MLGEEPVSTWEDPDANHLLEFLCGLILSLFMCAVLAVMAGSEEMRPKMLASPDTGASTLHHAATSGVPLASSLSSPTQSLRPVQSWPGGEVSEVSPRDFLSSPEYAARLLESALPPTRGISRSQHLCQGLVVPSGSECVLAVRLPQGVAWAEAQADVMDLTGRAVLAATLKPGAQASSREPAVVLKPTSTTPNATVANQVLARCYASRGSDGEIGMDICKANGEVYARLERDSSRPRYVMTKKAPNANTPHLLFDGIFKEHAVLVSDGIQAEPTADVEPCSMSFDPTGNFYRLRVSSDVDVGLMICCLLSIDELVRMGI